MAKFISWSRWSFKNEKIVNEIPSQVPLPNVEKIIQELNKCKTPLEMELFVGGENEKFQTKTMQIGLNPNNIEYLQNLQSEIGAELLKKK